MISERFEVIKSYDQTDLLFRVFTPTPTKNAESKLKGVVLAVHGLAEHSGRYREVAEKICAKNLAFACFDMRGHGQSGPERGDAPNIEALILDVIFMTNYTREILGLTNQPDSFFGLLGHSFGATIVTYAAAHLASSCPPIFLSAPCYKIKQKIPKWKEVGVKNIVKFAPQLSIPIGIDTNDLSNNPQNNRAYKEDKMNLTAFSTQFGILFFNALEPSRIEHAISLIRAPVTIVLPTADKICDYKMTQSLFPRFKVKGSKLNLIEGSGHEIFQEIDVYKEQAFHALEAWLDEFMPRNR